MMRFIRWLFTGDGHLHKWEVIEKESLLRISDGERLGTIYTLQCKECGEIKSCKVMG